MPKNELQESQEKQNPNQGDTYAKRFGFGRVAAREKRGGASPWREVRGGEGRGGENLLSVENWVIH